MALSGNQVTRLGQYGGSRGKYDLTLLANKVTALPKYEGLRLNVGKMLR